MFKSLLSFISEFQTETQAAVDIWIIDKFSVTYLIFICFGLMAPKHIFPSKSAIKSAKLMEAK